MPHPAEQIRFCTSRDGTRIAYAICGSGPPLVWLGQFVRHIELDWDSPVWRHWLLFLTRRHTLVRYDFRGCGLSDRDGVEFSHQRHVEDLEAVMDAAGLTRSILFGMAGGGAKAASYTVQHPDRVSHLVLYGSPTCARLADHPSPKQVEEAETRLSAIELGWPNVLPAYGQFYASLLIPDASPEVFHSFNELLRRATSATQIVALLRGYWRVDVREILPKIGCPTLVMHAREDSTIPFEQGRRAAALIPGARFVPLETRNHILMENEPAWRQFMDAFNDFVPAQPTQLSNGPEPVPDDLTTREHEVLELLARGLDNDTIASRLGIAGKTVRNQVSAIFSKLGVNSRAQAIVRARDAGFGRKVAGDER
jgi:pimeloyl-ACP methyl ester carboxylesterase/DNA-binding CsgD family transcriptional regulator